MSILSWPQCVNETLLVDVALLIINASLLGVYCLLLVSILPWRPQCVNETLLVDVALLNINASLLCVYCLLLVSILPWPQCVNETLLVDVALLNINASLLCVYCLLLVSILPWPQCVNETLLVDVALLNFNASLLGVYCLLHKRSKVDLLLFRFCIRPILRGMLSKVSIEMSPPPSGQNGGHFTSDIFKHIFSNGIFKFWLKFHWSLFLGFQLTIAQHWFRLWLGAE